MSWWSGENDVAHGPLTPPCSKRTDYTPADDEFMCRYLAYHYPDGAWQSRKTYAVMVSLLCDGKEEVTARNNFADVTSV